MLAMDSTLAKPGSNAEGSFVQSDAFSYWLGRADVSEIAWHDREIIRRLFVTVRDQVWQETPPVEWHVDLSNSPTSVSFKARHTSDCVDFEWEGTFRIDAGELSFEIEGRALRDMDVCRLGLVMLLPVIPLIGAQVIVEGYDGTENLNIRRELHPQPVVNGLPQAMTAPFSRLSMSMSGLGDLHSRFGGDLFELEDQRNWGDASFKVYCTPLRAGFPRRVTAGTLIEHRVQSQFIPSMISEDASAKDIWEIRLPPRPDKTIRFPTVGCFFDADQTQLSGSWDRSGWSFIRIDLNGAHVSPASLRALEQLPSTTELEFCIALEERDSIDPILIGLFKEFRPRIARILLRGVRSNLPSQEYLDRFRTVLDAAGAQGPRVLISTSGYFVELNRGVSLSTRSDGVAFPFTATVHAADAWTIAESPAVLEDLARTARSLSRQSNVSISPLALFHPPSEASFPRSLIIPWLLANLIQSAYSQVTSVTLAADVVNALRKYSSHNIRAWLQTWSDCSASSVLIGDLPDVYAIAVAKDDRSTDFVLVNLRKTALDFRWNDLNFRLDRAIHIGSGQIVSVIDQSVHLILPAMSAIIAAIIRVAVS
jgi:hypothetical protein